MDYIRYYLGNLVVLIGVIGFLSGGYWVILGVATFVPLLLADVLMAPDLKQRKIRYGWLADIPLYLHVVLMFVVYAAFLSWVASATTTAGTIPLAQLLGAALTLGWLGAVPNLPVNHELMHRRSAFARFCATVLGTFYADPTRDVAHIHTHHLWLATPRDSDTARRGETAYTFIFRATAGSFIDFLKSEKECCKRRSMNLFSPSGRIFKAIMQVTLLLGVCAWFGGLTAAATVFISMLMARAIVEMFNYHQHYGLVRVEDSKYNEQHIWNHLAPMSRIMSFEISNHNDHHMDSYLPFYRLKAKVDGPRMPSLFLCFLVSLVPPMWFKYIAKPRLRNWDLHHATDDERELAREANRNASWPDWLDQPSVVN